MTPMLTLTPATLDAFLSLIIPDDGVKRDVARQKYLSGERPWEDSFVLLHSNMPALAARLIPTEGDAMILSRLCHGGALVSGDVAALLDAVVRRAVARGASRVMWRPTVEVVSSDIADALRARNFGFVEERIEYRTDVASLPREGDDSPLLWRSMAEIGLDAAAEMFDRVSEATGFGLEPDETGAEAIRDALGAPGLSGEPGCVEVGYLEGTPVAFLITQIERSPASGWSRITFMGLVPEARGRGLGQWVHRRGFEGLRAKGGVVYHGGTAGGNVAMQALFEKHGCPELHRMQEWVWRPLG